MEDVVIGPTGEEHDREAALPKASLVGVKGKCANLEFQILAPTLYIGRLGSNDIALEDEKVSSVHARVAFVGGEFVLSDLRSKNGVLVGGERIDRVALVPGDTIQIGDTQFRFEMAGQKSSPRGQRRKRSAGGAAARSPMRLAIYGIGAVLFLLVVVVAVSEPRKPKEGADAGPTATPGLDLGRIRDDLVKESGEPNVAKRRDQEAMKAYTTGVILFDQREYKTAIESFEKALAREPGWTLAMLKLGQSQKALEEAIQRSYQQGNVEMQALRYQEAINSFKYVQFLAGPDHPTRKDAEARIAEAEAFLKAR
ncbi:MAG: FHA domain-containing protein [Candidatus Schekmanbacteria bacterium]|nr:FHA domain-containing protein [Candidatus Schekmanbacteria bacterium]